MQAFQAWFRYTIEERLKRLPDLKYEEEPDKIKVAIMTLAFNNADVIEYLKDRGEAIIDSDWDKVRDIERKLIDLKNRDNHKELKRLTTPMHIFMTF